VSGQKFAYGSVSLTGKRLFKAIMNGEEILYVPWFWRWIMLIIKGMPESIFKKLQLKYLEGLSSVTASETADSPTAEGSADSTRTRMSKGTLRPRCAVSSSMAM
jgi:hypothetical protein